MKAMIAWFATNSVAANLLMGFAVLAGLASLGQIPVKLYPDFDLPVITVTVPYLGAAPDEVESGICTRIEEQIEGINGIKEVRSTAMEGRCNVVVELFHDADRFLVLDDVDAQINAIDTFPQEAEKPIIQLVTPSSVVMEIAVTGPADERALKEMARRVRDDILRLDGVTHAEVT
ncbi:MAG: efflux RND transporter permease subunit, partial [Chromatiales bacterium]|nr:efflux RND transporter permease subunit [Chromatiales bacterium]